MPVDAAHVWDVRRQASSAGWVIPLTVAAGLLLAAARILAGPLVLPLAAMLLVTVGFGLVAVLYFTGSSRRGSAWHIAGALVLAGFAAALLSDGHEALQELGRIETRLAPAG